MLANRWGFSPSISFAQDLGNFHLELFGGYDFYTDNDDSLDPYSNSTRTLEKRVIYIQSFIFHT
jgi:hypothetical protein